jgi:hypothetical protein
MILHRLQIVVVCAAEHRRRDAPRWPSSVAEGMAVEWCWQVNGNARLVTPTRPTLVRTVVFLHEAEDQGGPKAAGGQRSFVVGLLLEPGRAVDHVQDHLPALAGQSRE